MLGCSAGGWAPIRFGMMLHAPRVWAFSPQTELYSNDMQLAPVTAARLCATHGPMDLVNFMDGTSTSIEIHYGEKNQKDAYHASRMQGIAKLVKWPTAQHAIAVWLRDRGILFTILERELPKEINT